MGLSCDVFSRIFGIVDRIWHIATAQQPLDAIQ
jgi:hypothetical protein